MDAATAPDGVGADHFTLGLTALYRPRFPISASARVACLGGRASSHVVQFLKHGGFKVIDEEPPPPGLGTNTARRFGYRLQSVRCGNITSVRQLRQLMEEARGEFKPADAVWERDGRYFDAMRWSVEPNGLSTPEVVADHRNYHLSMVRRVLENAEVLVLTFDTIDAWEHVPSGTVYPAAPAGEMKNAAQYRFRTFTAQEIEDDLNRVFAQCWSANPGMRFVLAASPGSAADRPGSGTSSDDPVSPAPLLRAAIWRLCRERPQVDYLPVYEVAGVVNFAASLAGGEPDSSALDQQSGVSAGFPPKATPKVLEIDDDEELERMLAGDDLCEEILDETFKP
jgi:hypothetical protein